jgi:hypothetical protein
MVMVLPLAVANVVEVEVPELMEIVPKLVNEVEFKLALADVKYP